MPLPSGHPYKDEPPRSRYVRPPPPLTSDAQWSATIWNEENAFAPLDLTGRVLTHDSTFTSASVVTNDNSFTGPWYAPGHANTSLAKFQRPTADASIFTIENGSLKIRMYNTGTEWRSGTMETVNLAGYGFTQTYGYWEARLAFDRNVCWPAFWLYTVNRYLDIFAPKCEIDIIEVYGDNDYDGHHSALHIWGPQRVLPGYRDDNLHSSDYTGLTAAGWPTTDMFDGSFHTYGCEVTPEWIIIYFDRMEMKRIRTPEEAKQPKYALVSLQMQDDYVAEAVETFMRVEYVRVYAPLG